jgi:hypothetical protein
MMTSAIMWNSWKMRNEIFFDRLIWSGLQIVWRRIAQLLRKWIPLCPPHAKTLLEEWVMVLDLRASETPRLRWR